MIVRHPRTSVVWLGLASLFMAVNHTALAADDPQAARREVLSALVDIESRDISRQERNAATQWPEVRELIVWLLAAHENIDHGQMEAVENQLASMQAQDPAYRRLYEEVAKWRGQALASTLASLMAVARHEADTFVEVDQASISELQQRLKMKLQALPNRLHLDDTWRTFLRWDELSRLPVASAPSVDEVDRILLRWSNAYTSWRQPELLATQQLLSSLAQALVCRENNESSSTRNLRLNRLDEILAIDQNLDISRRRAVQELYSEMTRTGQAPQLCAALAAQYSHANFVVRIDPAALEKRAAKPVGQSFPIQAIYAGTPVSGSGNFTGRMELDLRSSADDIRGNIRLAGQSIGHTRGARDRVSVRSTSVTSITSSREASFAGFGPPVWSPAQASATTTITFDNISADVPRRRRQSALNEVYSSRPASEARASDEARSWMSRELESRTDQLRTTDLLQRVYKFRDELFANDLGQPRVKCSSFPDLIDWRVWQAPPARFAADKPQPIKQLQGEIQIALHESFLSVMAEPKMAGRKIMAGENLDFISSSLMSMPAERPAAEAGVDHNSAAHGTIVLTELNPIDWKIEDGKVVVSLNLQRIEADGDTFLNYVASLTYRPQIESSRLRLVADENIDVLPSDFDPASEKLGARRLSLCRLIERRLKRFVTPDMWIADLRFDGERTGVVEILPITGASCESGWLAITFGSSARQIDIARGGRRD